MNPSERIRRAAYELGHYINQYNKEVERYALTGVRLDYADYQTYHELHLLADELEDTRHWNVAAHLPTPGIKLHCKLADGRIVDGVRPSYISDRKNDDLGYRSLDGEVLNVTEWSIQ